MDNNASTYGYLYFSTNKETPCLLPLKCGRIQLGSNGFIRIKNENNLSCVLDTDQNGVSTLINENQDKRISVNQVCAGKCTILKHGDHFQVGNKIFNYSKGPKKNDEHKGSQNLIGPKLGRKLISLSERKNPPDSVNVKRLRKPTAINNKNRRFSTGSQISGIKKTPKISERNLTLSKPSTTPQSASKLRFAQRTPKMKPDTLAAVKENEIFQSPATLTFTALTPARNKTFCAQSSSRNTKSPLLGPNKTFTGNLKEWDLNSCGRPMPTKVKLYSGNLSDASVITTTPENNVTAVSITPLNVSKKTSKNLNRSSSGPAYVEEGLVTPKSAIKGRRSDGAIYKPIVENITPVSPSPRTSLRLSSLKKPAFTQRRSVNFDICSFSDQSSSRSEDEPNTSTKSYKRKRSVSINSANSSKRTATEIDTSLTSDEVQNNNEHDSDNDSTLLGVNVLLDTSLHDRNTSIRSTRSNRSIVTVENKPDDNTTGSSLTSSDSPNAVQVTMSEINYSNHSDSSPDAVTYDEDIDCATADEEYPEQQTETLKNLSTHSKSFDSASERDMRERIPTIEVENESDPCSGNVSFDSMISAVSSSSLAPNGGFYNVTQSNGNLSKILDESFNTVDLSMASRRLSSTPLNYARSFTRRSQRKTFGGGVRAGIIDSPRITTSALRSKSLYVTSSTPNRARVSNLSKIFEATNSATENLLDAKRTRSTGKDVSRKSNVGSFESSNISNTLTKSVNLNGSEQSESFEGGDELTERRSVVLSKKKSLSALTPKDTSRRMSRNSSLGKVSTPLPRSYLKTPGSVIAISSSSDSIDDSIDFGEFSTTSKRRSSNGVGNVSKSTGTDSISSNKSSRRSNTRYSSTDINTSADSYTSGSNIPISNGGFDSSADSVFTDDLVPSRSSSKRPTQTPKSSIIDDETIFKTPGSVPVRRSITRSYSSPAYSTPDKMERVTLRKRRISLLARNSPASSTNNNTKGSLLQTFRSRKTSTSFSESNCSRRSNSIVYSYVDSLLDENDQESVASSSIRRSGRKSRPSIDEHTYDMCKPKRRLSNIQPTENSTLNSSELYHSSSGTPRKSLGTPKAPSNDPTSVRVAQRTTPKAQKSPKNDLTNVQGVKKLLRTPRVQQSPKNDLTNITGVEELLKTPSEQKTLEKIVPTNAKSAKDLPKTPKDLKSPKNDLLNISGIQNLFKTPQGQKTPRGNLANSAGAKQVFQKLKENSFENVTDIGVQKMSRTPRNTKYLTNDLPNIFGVLKAEEQVIKTPKSQNSHGNLINIVDVHALEGTPRVKNSPKNDLANVKKVLKSPKVQNSPKNDLTNIAGVKKLLKTPKVQNSPKNDLTNIAGVKKLLKTPKAQRSPKNDLTNIAGAKKLLRTPKEQKPPKDDLTNVAGVKKLLRTPKEQKPPKDDLTNVAGVKKLLKTPKAQKPPKNDLTNIAGVKKLLGTPQEQKPPKDDLTNVDGVKTLFTPPKQQKSPKNDLTEIFGVRKLFKSPAVISQKSPKNDYTQVHGVKRLLRTPKNQKGPKNDLTNVSGVKRLLKTPKLQREPNNDLTDVRGVRGLMKTPKDKSVYFNTSDISGIGNLFDQSKNDSFDELVGKKPLRTYNKSPRKDLQTDRLDLAPVQDENIPEVGEHVVQWVKEQTHLKSGLIPVETESQSGSRRNKSRRRIVDKTPENLKDDESMKTREELDKVVPKTRTRTEKAMKKSDEELVTAIDSKRTRGARKKISDYVDDVITLKIPPQTKIGRKKKLVETAEQIDNQKTSKMPRIEIEEKETLITKTKEKNMHQQVTPIQNSIATPPKRVTRRAKQQINASSEIHESTAEETKEIAKITNKSKNKNEELTVEINEKKKAVRNKRTKEIEKEEEKLNSLETVEPKTRKRTRGQNIVSELAEIEETNIGSAPPKQGIRGRRKKVEDIALQATANDLNEKLKASIENEEISKKPVKTKGAYPKSKTPIKANTILNEETQSLKTRTRKTKKQNTVDFDVIAEGKEMNKDGKENNMNNLNANEPEKKSLKSKSSTSRRKNKEEHTENDEAKTESDKVSRITRANKGWNNKYNNEEWHTPVKQSKNSKTVTFDPCVQSQKKVVPVITTRKSKRTRK